MTNQHPDGATLHLGGNAYAHPDLEHQLWPIHGNELDQALTPYPGNPRRGDQDAITASLRDLGLYRAIIAQRSTGHVLAGNHTLRGLRDLGAEQVPVTWLDVSDTRAAAIVARDNRTSELGGFDDADLLALLTADEDVLALSGYDDDAVAALTRALEPPPAPPAPKVRQPTRGPGTATLYHGNNLDVLAKLPADSIDAVVCDPPYGIDFMGRAWDDYGAPSAFAAWCQEWAEALLRVVKPGGHLIAFGATRTHHRLMQGVEDAGWVMRDCGVWLYRSGFPKSLDVSKAIDRAAGAERPVTGTKAVSRIMQGSGDLVGGDVRAGEVVTTGAATEDAAAWEGWGTALKPAIEPWLLARKPLSEGTVAGNVLRWGTGALNIDATRAGEELLPAQRSGSTALMGGIRGASEQGGAVTDERVGRWPANVVTGEDDDDLRFFRYAVGQAADYPKASPGEKPWTEGGSATHTNVCEDCGATQWHYFESGCPKCGGKLVHRETEQTDLHPTVKPLALMAHLIRLVTPPGGTVLDPFAGTGTTGEAAVTEGFDTILIEQHEPYLRWINARLDITPTRLRGVKAPKPETTEALAEPVAEE